METIGVEDARHRLGDLVDAARLADMPTVITRYGKAAAVIVPMDWFERARVLVEREGERS